MGDEMIYRAVFHLDEDDEERVLLLLTNVRNLMADIPDVEIEVVAYSKGVSALMRESEYSDMISELIGDGVRFSACSNTMKAVDITSGDLVDGVDTVSSGWVRLLESRLMDGPI
ncbi:DsrE family protein [Methanothermobacter sp.]|uniref:DsrE family protein n=1 Tax=Methanothermobacter sp. TaxID=1884223 RepID=UPI003C741DB6